MGPIGPCLNAARFLSRLTKMTMKTMRRRTVRYACRQVTREAIVYIEKDFEILK